MTGDMAEPGPLEYDPFVPREDPFPIYARLRDEAPVYHSSRWGFWALSRFDDVQAAARDHETFVNRFSNDLDETYEIFAPTGDLGHFDPPDHTRLRNAVRREFSPNAIREQLAHEVRKKTLELLDDFRGCTDVDFAADFARALPSHIIRAWLGFPEEDHGQLLEWFDEMNRRIPGQLELPASALVARDSMRAYIQAAAERRRRREQTDLLTPLARAHAAGDITMDELLALAMLLYFAGIITTAGLLSTSLRLLAERPADRLALREEPARIPDAVEEFLRFDSPLQFLARTTIREVEAHGQKVPAGAKVVLLWGAANRDERRWERPDDLDLTREPQRHLAFGAGIHHCLGAPLARLEGAIALEEILRVVGDWEISGPVERLYSPNERVLLHLPVRIPVLAT